MPELFGNLPDKAQNKSPDAADANFYVIIRQTIQGLDTLVLNVTLQGSTFLLVFLGVAAWLFERKLCLPLGPGINLGPHGAWIVAGGASVLALSLYLQLKRFVGLQEKAIEIGKKVEAALLAEEFRLTHQFETVSHAGRQGKFLVEIFLLGMFIVSVVALIFFLIAGVSEWQRGVPCE